MRLRPDCPGCEADSNDPDAHLGVCNYSQWPGLYDTIEAQRNRIDVLERELCRPCDDRHHDAVLLFVKHRLTQPEPMSGGELAEWAHLMANYLYPPPGSVFEPELLHYRNPPPKAEE